jgi:hydrogenase/urease accessory protein HupE
MTDDRNEWVKTIANGLIVAFVLFVAVIAVAAVYAIVARDPGPLIVVVIGVLGLIIGFASGSKFNEFVMRRAARDIGREYELRKRR